MDSKESRSSPARWSRARLVETSCLRSWGCAALGELGTLGQTLKKRAADVLAYFNHPGTSKGPTETINGRLEHLRGSATGFRNLTSPDPYSRPAGSGRNYTLDHKEPIFLLLSTAPVMRAWYYMF